MHNFCEIVEAKIPINEWCYSEFHLLCVCVFKCEIHQFIIYYVYLYVLFWSEIYPWMEF